MKTFAKTVVFTILLLAIPMKHFGQTMKSDIIKIELSAINNPDFRYCLLSYVAHDENISYVINEEESSVLLSSTANLDNQQFQDYYDSLRSIAEDDFRAYSIADKETQGISFSFWKENLPQDLFVLLFRQMLIENPTYRDGNQTCATSDPFCTTDVVTFHIDANPGTVCEPGPDYGCMSSFTQRPPFWFHMKIAVAGTFTIRITNTNNNDLDFCAWGPFSDPTTPCTSQLTADKIIDCDSPYNSVQECTIPSSSQVGQYYLMVITKWSSGATDVSFSKVANSGPGETDCGILPGVVTNDGPYCVGETIHLSVNAQDGATYSWTGPAGFTSNLQNPTRPNCTMNMAGTYTCTTTVGTQSVTASTEVVIYPMPTANFNYTTVCLGNPTQFTSTSTTNPSGQQITNYQWNFGDGQTSTLQSPSHTYANAGTYTVTLTVSCGNGLCTSTKTQSVIVYAEPSANAGPDQTIPFNTSTQLSGSGGAGTFNYHWEPANMVINPNAQNTQTVVLTQDQTYTLTVTNPQGDCSGTDQVTIHIEGGALTVSANANPASICAGSSTQLTASAGGGMGSCTYSWTPTTGLSNPNIYNPVATPTQTTTYTCTVHNPQTNQTATATVTVVVHHAGYSEETHYICPNETYEWHGQTYSDEGDYEFPTTTQYGCDSIITLHLYHYPTYDETLIEEAICAGESYNFFGNIFTSPTQTSHTLQTIHGCDSIIRLDLTVYPDNGITDHPVTVCPSQLPFYYEEDPYEIPLYAGDHLFHLQDIHGCDSVVVVQLTVSEYYIPPIQTEYVCYVNEPSFTWDANGQTYHTEGLYTDTIPYSVCEGIFRLDLHFQQVPETIVDEVVACDTYTWPRTGYSYDESGDYYHYVSLDPFPCQQEYKLSLTINTQSLLDDETFSGVCDAVPVSWFGQDTTFTANTVFTFTGLTDEGCYREQTYHIESMHYTPNPDGIKCSDASAVVYGDTIAVVTNTEFFSFQYTFFVEETNRECVWQSCNWTISKPSWALVFNPIPSLSLNGKYYSECTVYVADRQNEYVELTATIANDCGTQVRKFYLKSSFLDVDENQEIPAKVDIVPNPNNGQMHIDFENMEGRTTVKVFDMTGNQIDAFETTINSNRYNYDYNMKCHADGLYFFVVSNNSRVFTKKVVVIH